MASDHDLFRDGQFETNIYHFSFGTIEKTQRAVASRMDTHRGQSVIFGIEEPDVFQSLPLTSLTKR